MLKPGDKVVMNDRYHVSEENKAKVWTVKSEPWNCCGTMVVKLEGKAGGYAVDGLDLLEKEKPFTRGDHIRSRNDDELSKEFYAAIDAAFTAISDLLGLKISFSDFVYEDEWKNKFTEWLKQPADMPKEEESP